MMNDSLDEFEEKVDAKSPYLAIALLLLISIPINLFLYYRPFTFERLSEVSSSVSRILFAFSYHILPLIGLVFFLKHRTSGWILIAIYAINRTIIDLNAFIFRPETNNFFRYKSYFFLVGIGVIILLGSPSIRSQFKIKNQNLLLTLFLGIALSLFLIYYI